MWMVKNPEWFDVIVTGNMFGDIITDLGAITQGGMGVAAGGNLNPEGVSMFEPIGGSAPKYTGKNIINPLAAICCGGMMLEHLGESAAAQAIEEAVMDVTANKLKSLGAGKKLALWTFPSRFSRLWLRSRPVPRALLRISRTWILPFCLLLLLVLIQLVMTCPVTICSSPV